MENKKERKKTEQEAREIADSELDQVSGGFLRKIESKIPSTGTDGTENENGAYNP